MTAKRQPKQPKQPPAIFAHLGNKRRIFEHIRAVLGGYRFKAIAEPFAGTAAVARSMGVGEVYLAEAHPEIRAVLEALARGDVDGLSAGWSRGSRFLYEKWNRDFYNRERTLTDRGWRGKINALHHAARALKDAVVLDDAFALFDALGDDPDVAWFVDPPYPQTSMKGYAKGKGGWGMDDHRRVLDALARCSGPVVMTGYENMRPPKHMGFREVAVIVTCPLAKGDKRTRVEYIWHKRK